MIKAPLEAELRDFASGMKTPDNSGLAYMNAYSHHGYFEDMKFAENADQLPEIMAFLGFGSFFRKPFRELFVDAGVFETVPSARPGRSLENAGFLDPMGRYSVIAVNPMVMVADHAKLKGRPLPSRWSDILEPEYERSVGVVGREGSFNETLSLALYKESGMQGIERLRWAVGFAGHPAQMVKMAGTNHPDAPAINVIDYFFAKMVRHQERITIIWPEDGALAVPFVALVKRSVHREPVCDFLTGRTMARICSDAYFYPVYGDLPADLPSPDRLKWPGWEYVRDNVERIADHVRESACAAREGGTDCGS
ncbi:MAG: ABC transporter substrate-binding protein [Syntrophorhabdaceae bacterium]